MGLPYELPNNTHNLLQNKPVEQVIDVNGEPEVINLQKELTIALINVSTIEKKKVEETLQKLINSGDPIMELEIYITGSMENLFTIPTKPSYLLRSLNDSFGVQSCVYRGDIPIFKKRSNFYKVLRWWTCALLFLLLSWILFYSPEFLENYYFKPRLYEAEWVKNHQLAQLLPIEPSSLYEAWRFGEITNQLEIAIQLNDSDKQ